MSAWDNNIWYIFLYKNTWHVESNHILQPPNYLIIVVNRFRYINNQFAKDKCSIPMDMTVVLGYHKFSLQATIDHHGPSIYSGHYTTSVNCCNRTFYCNDNKITEFDMINTKNSSAAYVVSINWLHNAFGLEQEDGNLIIPMALAHPLLPINSRSRNKRRNLWVGWCVSSWWP